MHKNPKENGGPCPTPSKYVGNVKKGKHNKGG